MFEDINHQVTIISVLSIRKFPADFLLPSAAMEAIATQWAHGPITCCASCPKKKARNCGQESWE